jgi:hypothetical protein
MLKIASIVNNMKTNILYTKIRQTSLVCQLILWTLLLSTVSLLWASPASAANSRLYLSPAGQSITTGANFNVTMLVDAAEAVNVVEAKISYPANLLDVVSLSNAVAPFDNSYANSATNGTIAIGRYALSPVSGNGKTVVTITFKAKAAGSAGVNISTNGGETFVASAATSTPVPLTISSAAFSISSPAVPPTAAPTTPTPKATTSAPSSSPSKVATSSPSTSAPGGTSTSSGSTPTPAPSTPAPSSGPTGTPAATSATPTTADQVATNATPEKSEAKLLFGTLSGKQATGIAAGTIVTLVMLACCGVGIRIYMTHRAQQYVPTVNAPVVTSSVPPPPPPELNNRVAPPGSIIQPQSSEAFSHENPEPSDKQPS